MIKLRPYFTFALLHCDDLAISPLVLFFLCELPFVDHNRFVVDVTDMKIIFVT